MIEKLLKLKLTFIDLDMTYEILSSEQSLITYLNFRDARDENSLLFTRYDFTQPLSPKTEL